MSSSRNRRLHRINKKKVSTKTLVRTASFSMNTVSTLELSHGAPASTRPMEATDGAPQRMRMEDGLLVGLEGGVVGTGLGSHLMDRTSTCRPPDGILLPASCEPGKWGSMLEDAGGCWRSRKFNARHNADSVIIAGGDRIQEASRQRGAMPFKSTRPIRHQSICTPQASKSTKKTLSSSLPRTIRPAPGRLTCQATSLRTSRTTL